MFAAGLLSMLAGVVLGVRFRVFILVPAIMLVWMVIAAFGIASHDTFWRTVMAMLVAAAALQTGYLVGATRALAAEARAPRPRTASRWGAARSTGHAIISD